MHLHSEPALPPALHKMLDPSHPQPISIGRSGIHIYHIGPNYLKIAPRSSSSDLPLQAEKERLAWLQPRIRSLIPHIHYYGHTDLFEYLYLSEIPGIMAYDQQFRTSMPALIDLLAQTLHIIHFIPIPTKKHRSP